MGAPTIAVQKETKEKSLLGEARNLAKRGSYIASIEGGGYTIEGIHTLEEAILKYEDHISSISLGLSMLKTFAKRGGKITEETLDGVIKKVAERE